MNTKTVSVPQKSMEAILKKINTGTIHEEDGVLFLQFLDDMITFDSWSPASIEKYVTGLTQIFAMVHKLGLQTNNIDAIGAKELIHRIKSHPWSEWTRHTRMVQWQKYCRWLWKNNKDSLPPAFYTAFVNREEKFTYKMRRQRIKKKEILTPEEMLRIVHAEPIPSWRAFFAVTYEGGLRYCEVANLQLKDVVRDPVRGYNLRVRTTKTDAGLRDVPIMEFSLGYLEAWLSQHPARKDPEAYVFLNEQRDFISNFAAGKRLKALVRRVGIEKHITMHCLRHSRATAMGNDPHINEYGMNKLFGWTMASRQASVYIHREGLDPRAQLMKSYGYSTDEAKEQEKHGRACPVCEALNPFAVQTCAACHAPMSSVEFRRMAAERAELEEAYMRMLEERYTDLIARIKAELRAERENSKDIKQSSS